MAKKIHLKTTDKVLRLLHKYPESRSNNQFLDACVWAEQLQELGKDLDKTSAREFLKLYSTKSFTEGAIIGRVSRLIQVINVSLRGENFEKNRGLKKRNETLTDLEQTKDRVK